MRRDFGGAAARDNKWEDKPRNSRQQTFMENGDLNNADFEEYYKAQVCVYTCVCLCVSLCEGLCVSVYVCVCVSLCGDGLTDTKRRTQRYAVLQQLGLAACACWLSL